MIITDSDKKDFEDVNFISNTTGSKSLSFVNSTSDCMNFNKYSDIGDKNLTNNFNKNLLSKENNGKGFSLLASCMNYKQATLLHGKVRQTSFVRLPKIQNICLSSAKKPRNPSEEIRLVFPYLDDSEISLALEQCANNVEATKSYLLEKTAISNSLGVSKFDNFYTKALTKEKNSKFKNMDIAAILDELSKKKGKYRVCSQLDSKSDFYDDGEPTLTTVKKNSSDDIIISSNELNEENPEKLLATNRNKNKFKNGQENSQNNLSLFSNENQINPIVNNLSMIENKNQSNPFIQESKPTLVDHNLILSNNENNKNLNQFNEEKISSLNNNISQVESYDDINFIQSNNNKAGQNIINTSINLSTKDAIISNFNLPSKDEILKDVNNRYRVKRKDETANKNNNGIPSLNLVFTDKESKINHIKSSAIRLFSCAKNNSLLEKEFQSLIQPIVNSKLL